MGRNKDSFEVTSYIPYNCPPSTHTQFKPRNSAWYIASRLKRDITINRHIKPKEIQERAGIYHQLQDVPYKLAWRARERLRNILDGDEGASFGLIPDWGRRILDNSTTSPYLISKLSDDMRFEALFVITANYPHSRVFYRYYWHSRVSFGNYWHSRVSFRISSTMPVILKLKN